MDVFATRRERLRELNREFTQTELAQRSGIAVSIVSRYLYEPDKAGAKNLGEKNARRLEKAGYKPPGWLDKAHAPAGLSLVQVGHRADQWRPAYAPHLTWGEQMSKDTLPPLFWVALPDDSMAPRAPAGRHICFEKDTTPNAGDGVLVADQAGGLYFRQYRAGAAGRWTAHALNPAYEDLDSERDGLQVLAVLKAEEGRWS